MNVVFIFISLSRESVPKSRPGGKNIQMDMVVAGAITPVTHASPRSTRPGDREGCEAARQWRASPRSDDNGSNHDQHDFQDYCTRTMALSAAVGWLLVLWMLAQQSEGMV